MKGGREKPGSCFGGCPDFLPLILQTVTSLSSLVPWITSSMGGGREGGGGGGWGLDPSSVGELRSWEMEPREHWA